MQYSNEEKRLFGFSYRKDDKEFADKISPIPPNSDDGVTLAAGGVHGYGMSMDSSAQKDYELIRRYRCMALSPEVDSAIEEIVNEAIVSDTNDTPVNIDLSNIDISERIKVIMREEFAYILHLLDFNNQSHEMFRRWYIDGRLYYHKVIDLTKPERGITDIRNIDALKIKEVREYRPTKYDNKVLNVLDQSYSQNSSGTFGQLSNAFPNKVLEYFLYNKQGINSMLNTNSYGKDTNIKIAKDAITYVTSGLVDGNTGQVLSYLNKAIKPLNQLKWMEDSIVIYRMARAPERRLFYIDVGNLPKAKAEQYLRDVMARYRTTISYNQATGEIKDSKKFTAMLEDYWLPRREGGRGTEVSTLAGGQNLGELADLDYFKDKLFQSLNVPASRMGQEQSTFQIGKSDNIMRDEVNFSKFVGRMRKRFSMLFTDMLKTQLVLKGVITPKEFESMKEHIQFNFIYDNHFAELRKSEMLQNSLQVAAMMEPYIGKYFSVYHVRKEVFGQTDEQLKEMDKQISYERNVGIIPDPNAQQEEPPPEEGQEQPMDPNAPPPDDLDLSGMPMEAPPSGAAQQMAGIGAPPPMNGNGGMPKQLAGMMPGI